MGRAPGVRGPLTLGISREYDPADGDGGRARLFVTMEEVLLARMRQEPSFVEAEAQIELLDEELRALRQGLVERGTSGPESDDLVSATAHKLSVIKFTAARLRSSEQRLSSWHEGRGEYDKSYARVFIQRRLTALERQVDALYRDEVAARVIELSKPRPEISLLPDDSWRFVD